MSFTVHPDGSITTDNPAEALSLQREILNRKNGQKEVAMEGVRSTFVAKNKSPKVATVARAAQSAQTLRGLEWPDFISGLGSQPRRLLVILKERGMMTMEESVKALEATGKAGVSAYLTSISRQAKKRGFNIREIVVSEVEGYGATRTVILHAGPKLKENPV